MRVSVDGQCLSAQQVDPASRRFVWQLIAAFTRSSAGIEMETLTLDRQIAEALRSSRIRGRLLRLPPAAERPNLQSYAERVNVAFRIGWLEFPPDIIFLPDLISPEVALIEPYGGVPVVALVSALPGGEPGSHAYERFARKIHRLRESNAWLLVTSLALRDWLSQHNLVSSERIETISSPVDLQRFAPVAEGLAAHDQDREPRVVTIADARTLESLPTLFEAFAKLPSNLGRTRLSVVADIEDDELMQNVKKAASEETLDPRRWEFVPDEEEVLATLLRSSQVFVYPAVEDHIGAPLLQSLAAGCPTICAESGVLPELAGTAAFIQPAGEVDLLRERVSKLLRQPGERETYIQRGQVRARKYSSRQCAGRLVQTFHQEYRPEAAASGDLRVGYVSPFPPMATGVAHYSNQLARELRDYADVHVFTHSKEDLEAVLKTRFQIFSLDEFPLRYAKYDIVVYNLASRGDLFQPYFDLISRYPGVVILHDINLHKFFWKGMVSEGNGAVEHSPYYREMEFCYGGPGAEVARLELTGKIAPDPARELLNNRLTRRSRGIAVHSQWAARTLLENGDSSPVLVMPHGGQIDPQFDQMVRTEVKEASQRIGDFLIAATGHFDMYWRLASLLEAVARLKASGLRPVLMLLGDQSPEARQLQDDTSQKLRITDIIMPMGYVRPYDAFLGHLAAADVIVDLRGKESGSTSGAALAAMAIGKPAIVGDLPQNRELPHRAVFKIPYSDLQVPMLTQVLEVLAKNPGMRRTMGMTGKNFVAQAAAWPLVARRFSAYLYEIARRYHYVPPAE